VEGGEYNWLNMQKTRKVEKVTASERSALQIYRKQRALWRGVEEPVPSVAEGTPAMRVCRCSWELSGRKLQRKKKVTNSKRSREICGSTDLPWKRGMPRLNRIVSVAICGFHFLLSGSPTRAYPHLRFVALEVLGNLRDVSGPRSRKRDLEPPSIVFDPTTE
jgi:hypothetical protein